MPEKQKRPGQREAEEIVGSAVENVQQGIIDDLSKNPKKHQAIIDQKNRILRRYDVIRILVELIRSVRSN